MIRDIIYPSNNRTPKYMKPTLEEFNKEKDNSKIVVGDWQKIVHFIT